MMKTFIHSLLAEALTDEESENVPVCFYVKHGILIRKWRPLDATVDEEWKVHHQIVVLKVYENEILGVAHEIPFAGHLALNIRPANVY
ncbi:hypothetical protein HOLleu_40734 [Holothuria leucospilota]|uniref:Uncharacterized protein n=1 Tax=Holothuria leucospilota TaxID=206669 RepID=A0A9Q0YLE0_HOLLE|nr:hypothetical protein HOLleu_40734 [Holothuria leucospilota]